MNAFPPALCRENRDLKELHYGNKSSTSMAFLVKRYLVQMNNKSQYAAMI
jgi:hypothetical protein